MMNALDISASGLVAQRTRMEAISTNIANMNATRNENGDLHPFQARFAVLETDTNLQTSSGGIGVKVKSVEKETVEPTYKYEPFHRHAGVRGEPGHDGNDAQHGPAGLADRRLVSSRGGQA